ncbi:hypothetical protein [Janthinobacterium rivuli]|uniref:hypothetical protein n=1 Tax=Janthinobacterium rivuli TaxID=2751478 RepID=UPI00383BB1F1
MNSQYCGNGNIKMRIRGGAKIYKLENVRKMSEFKFYSLGDDYVVYDDDPFFQKDKTNFLSMSETIDIREKDSAEKIVQLLAVEPDVSKLAMPNEVGVIGDMGILSKIDIACKAFFFSARENLGFAMEKHVFPVMLELKFWKASSLTMNVDSFYSRVSFCKMLYLINKFGDKSHEAIFDRRLFSDVLPSPIDPIELFNALNVFPPYVTAMTMHRPGSAVIFIGNEIKSFHYRAFESLPNYLYPEMKHLMSNEAKSSLGRGNYNLEAEKLSEIIVLAVNSYWDFFTSPISWVDEDGYLNELKQIKGMGLAKLLISDVMAIQRSSSSFARNRVMFEFFDKLSSLCMERKEGVSEYDRQRFEAALASKFMQSELLELVSRIFKFQYRKTRNKAFLLLEKFSMDVKLNVIGHFGKIYADAGEIFDSNSIEECVRLIRNMAHGTFLGRRKFEDLFLKLRPSLPSDVDRLPWLYIFAFSLDPVFFIKEVGVFSSK